MKLRILSAVAAATVLLSSVWLAAPAQAAEVNLVPDPILRQCIANAMHQAGTGASPGTPEFTQEAASISQTDLDALAIATTWNYGLYCDDGVATLEGLQYLHDTQLTMIKAENGSIADLSPLSEFTNLTSFVMDHNEISDLSPLSSSNLYEIDADNNEIDNLSVVRNMTNLQYLDVSFNSITDLSPLTGLPMLWNLYIAGNEITDLAPIADLPLGNRPPKPGWLQSAANHISDISVITTLCTQADEDNNRTLEDSLDEGWVTCVYPNAAFQTLTDTAVAGSSVALPSVVGQSDDPVTWRVTQGDATITDGVVTYPTAGTYVLQFQDTTYDGGYFWIYGTDEDADKYNADTCALQNGTWAWNDSAQHEVCTVYADFSGIVTVTVTGRGEPPVAPMSDAVKKDEIAVSTTGGAARLANGTDSYTLVVTLNTAGGVPAPGYGDELSASVEPTGVSVSGLVDNGDGTYSMKVVSADPGNYTVTVKLNGVEVGDPIPVNFIGADVGVPSVNVANDQTATGLGFLPREQVSVTVHSDPLSVGTYKADGLGRVAVTFSMPKGFDLGAHTVDFVGVTSGTAVAGFSVVDMSAGTGGTAIPSSGTAGLALVAAVCLSAGFAVSMMVRKAR